MLNKYYRLGLTITTSPPSPLQNTMEIHVYLFFYVIDILLTVLAQFIYPQWYIGHVRSLVQHFKRNPHGLLPLISP